jgi:hypothetical protein
MATLPGRTFWGKATGVYGAMVGSVVLTAAAAVVGIKESLDDNGRSFMDAFNETFSDNEDEFEEAVEMFANFGDRFVAPVGGVIVQGVVQGLGGQIANDVVGRVKGIES